MLDLLDTKLAKNQGGSLVFYCPTPAKGAAYFRMVQFQGEAAKAYSLIPRRKRSESIRGVFLLGTQILLGASDQILEALGMIFQVLRVRSPHVENIHSL